MLDRKTFTENVIKTLTDEQKIRLVQLVKRIYPNSRSKTNIKIQARVILRYLCGYPGNYGDIEKHITHDDRVAFQNRIDSIFQ